MKLPPHARGRGTILFFYVVVRGAVVSALFIAQLQFRGSEFCVGWFNWLFWPVRILLEHGPGAAQHPRTRTAATAWRLVRSCSPPTGNSPRGSRHDPHPHTTDRGRKPAAGAKEAAPGRGRTRPRRSRPAGNPRTRSLPPPPATPAGTAENTRHPSVCPPHEKPLRPGPTCGKRNPAQPRAPSARPTSNVGWCAPSADGAHGSRRRGPGA